MVQRESNHLYLLPDKNCQLRSMLAEKYEVLEKPTLRKAAVAIREAIAQHQCITIVGRCRVEYQGRARSTLESGERIVIVKEDGATLVHRPNGYEPINWQPSGCILRTSLADEVFLLEAIRRAPSEHLRVVFDKVYVFFAMKLIDAGRFDLHVSEKEMQSAILAEPTLLEEGFRPIAYEKRVEPGFLDLYGVDGTGRLVVVEIKRMKAGRSAVLQLARYVDEVRKDSRQEVRGVLAAPKTSKGVAKLLATLGLDYRTIDVEKCARIITAAKKRKIHDFF